LSASEGRFFRPSLGRRGQGSELNAGYFSDSLHYLKAAEMQARMPDLFAALEIEEPGEIVQEMAA